MYRYADHYDWFSGFLKARSVARYVRAFIVTLALLMTASVLLLLTSAGGPTGGLQKAMMWTAVGGGLVSAALWARRWPTRRQSAAFAAVTTTSITFACLAYPDPLAALLGCIAFTTIGAYLAFFHSTKSVLTFVAIASTVALAQAVRMAVEGRAALAAVDFFMIVQANIAMPVAIHGLLRALRGDLVLAQADADHDPLTGLLNRRAFRRHTLNLLSRGGPGRYLSIAMVDLDDFKALNDALGHAAGDQALIAVAQALRAGTAPSAVIARAGGEEFLIADVTPADHSQQSYQEVCDAIADLDVPVTASVGTAVAFLDTATEGDIDTVVDHLIETADSAMYRAKRNGGNQCHHHGIWPGTAAS